MNYERKKRGSFYETPCISDVLKKFSHSCFVYWQNLLQVCERIPTIGTQLKILSTVKATMLGAQGS